MEYPSDVRDAMSLLNLKQQEGWKQVQALIDDRTAQADHLNVNCLSTDPNVVLSVHRSMRATKLFGQAIESLFISAEQRLKDYAEEQQQEKVSGY